MRRSLIAVACAALAFMAPASVEASRHHRHVTTVVPGRHSPPTESTPHPELTADAETLALWSKVRSELEARNYTRPTRAQLIDLGYLDVNAPEGGVLGADVSSWVGESTWGCMKNSGHSIGIAREFQETCSVDPNGVHTIANGWAAKMAHMDIYLFPSYGCGLSAAQQVDRTIDSMGSIPFGTLWLDIETGGQKDAAFNHKWFVEALAEGTKRIGAGRMGVYASAYEWSQVMGGEPGAPSYQLWYPNYDGQQSFADFHGFAGWSHPVMKQYAGSVGLCGASVDLNWA